MGSGGYGAGLREPATQARKQSLFQGVMDHRRESKANKRREELKRMIRVVPEGDGVQEQDEETEEWF